MKRMLVVATAMLIGIITMCGCGSTEISLTNQGQKTESSVGDTGEDSNNDTMAVALNTTVTTDRVDFTLEKAQFTIACSNTVDDNYLLPKEYDAANDNSNPHVASVGKTLVALTFTITNRDRTSLNVPDSSGWHLDWKVLYKGNEWRLKRQGTDSYGIDFHYASVQENDGSWKRSDTDNKILQPGQSITVRTYGVLDMEPDDLSDDFVLTVNLPSSSGYQMFDYQVK